MPVIRFDITDGIAVITLDDPDYRNAFGVEMASELYNALVEVEKNEVVRCLVLTGEGKAFCAGGKFVQDDNPAPDALGIGFLRKYAMPVIAMLKNLRCPVIGALNGPALGYGVGLSLMNDITYASSSTYFRLAFSQIGLVADGGATWILPRLIGPKRTAELAMFDDKLWADEAQSWGMVNKVVDDDQLMNEAMQAAARLAAGPCSLGYIRDALWNTWQNSFESQLELEAQLMQKANATNDYAEGTAAFMEKREPKFTGT